MHAVGDDEDDEGDDEDNENCIAKWEYSSEKHMEKEIKRK